MYGGSTGLVCLSCETQWDPSVPQRCPDCGGPLDPRYDGETPAVDGTTKGDERTWNGLDSALDSVPAPLPFDDELLPSLGVGGTPLVDCPALADEYGVGRLLLKAEGQQPTGGLVDREMALAVTAAREHGAERVALPSTGNGGQAAAAFAARAGLDATVYVPSRAPFQNKAMINVPGGDMTVVGGRYPDAVAAFEGEEDRRLRTERDVTTYSLAPFDTPYRHEGAKTLAYELVDQLSDAPDAPDTPNVPAAPNAPDAVVHPTGHGTALLGIQKGFRELEATGQIDGQPRLYAAQPEGCAPVVDCWERYAGSGPVPDIEAVARPDTICGSLEVPDPAGGQFLVEALAATGGEAIGVPDAAALDAALALAGEGVSASATGGVAARAVATLAAEGTLGPADTVVVVDPATANREADLLRSRLMSKGV